MQVGEAKESDVSSLSTIFERSFHPVNPYLKECFPPTQLVRDWWKRTFVAEIKAKDCNVLIVRDTSDAVVGVLCLRECGAEDSGEGLLYTIYDLTPDHDRAACEPMFAGMEESRPALLGTEPHFMIELLGVDHAYKGQGLGSKLLSRASELADEAGLKIFVQANHTARAFYERFGYESKREDVMPGEEGYTECMMIRPVGGKASPSQGISTDR